MKATMLTQALMEVYPAKVPLWIAGQPGIGKSQVVQQAAIAQGVQFLDVRPLLHDPSDFKFPLMNLEKETVKWVQSIFPRERDWAGYIALEELGLCPKLTQGALLQVTLDRKIGDYTLPDGAFMVALSNRVEDRAGVGMTISALNNRFTHVELETSLEDWQSWASLNGVAPEIRAFINFKPGLLNNFDPTSNEKAFATPRSWVDMVNKMLPIISQNLYHDLFAGAVGQGPAVEFIAFLNVWRDLPDVDVVLSKPSTHTIPKSKADVMYALCGALAERSKTLPSLDALATYACRFPAEGCAEFGALLLRETYVANSKKESQKIVGNPKLFAGKMTKWIDQHRDVLLSGGLSDK